MQGCIWLANLVIIAGINRLRVSPQEWRSDALRIVILVWANYIVGTF